ncbi:hypothetical protein D1646_15255 [Pseudoflavonifractor sp. 60]|uniref:hypothetical protein n=1 Tax=Pseudoflavonifractor sp. 60 TaxID=2304576 RepID=UPI00136FEACE|nr:hypothetical protein [Pseudoflavonifractor sp. 60]NBI68136.1 hypothetical protein [Pseudoflavonifractor sp. 60]
MMWRWWKKPRKIVVDGRVYRWVLADCPRWRELRVYREGEKQPVLRLGLTYSECWGIDLFRPRTAAYVIGWQEGRGVSRSPVFLREEPALLEGLLDLSFAPEEQEERARFLERIKTDNPPPYKWEY